MLSGRLLKFFYPLFDRGWPDQARNIDFVYRARIFAGLCYNKTTD